MKTILLQWRSDESHYWFYQIVQKSSSLWGQPHADYSIDLYGYGIRFSMAG